MRSILGLGLMIYGFYLGFIGNGYMTSNDKLIGLFLLIVGYWLAFIVGIKEGPADPPTGTGSTGSAGSSDSVRSYRTQQTTSPQKELLSVDIPDGSKFSSYLNSLQYITSLVAMRFPYREIPIYVGVQKINETYCGVYFGFEDLPDTRNLNFGDDFKITNDSASFMTEKATAFSTPEKVKKEIELQFNWPDLIPSRVTESNVVAHGQMAAKPLISYRMIVGPAKKR